MKKLLTLFIILSSCNVKNSNNIDNNHIEYLAKDFMQNTVIPKMKDPKPYEIVNAKVVIRTVADQLNDYQFVYDKFSFNEFDSIQNKKQLDSVIKVSRHPDSILNVTVNVAYKTKYKLGDVVTDSIKLGYDREKDRVSFWPF
ncbi:MAG: hypothetical protein M3Z26_17850 [Bacteroidota bacterium]|nr:hypothetical protein [Bacteroidota bacterium]